MSHFDLLSNDIIREIALYLSLRDIKYLCLTNSRFNRIICRDEGFWRQKFIHDFDFNPIDYRGSWKYLYQQYGNVWVCGNNKYRQLGLDQVQQVNIPTRIGKFNLLFKARQISAGVSHTVVIDIQNNVWIWGSNKCGELGLGHNEDQNVPTKIPNFLAQQVSATDSHTVFIDMENNVWGCGNNRYRGLGLGDNQHRNVLTQILNFRAKQVSTGLIHTLFIDLEDNVWVCGDNQFGQLGLGDDQYRCSPTPIPNINLGKAKQVVAGIGHTVIIDLNDNVWVCGHNRYGRLGLGDTLDRNIPTILPNMKARQISASLNHTIILDLENNVWVCGNNRHGQLGINQPQSLVPIKIPNINLLGRAQQISSGQYHTVIIDMENNVWTCGRNDGGQLGLGDTENRRVLNLVPNIRAQQVSCGYYHTVIIEM